MTLIVGVGTALWTVALVVLLFFTDDLRHDGHLWWIASAGTGVGLGLVGLVVVRLRERRLAQRT
jgi:hypothetical protein